LLWAAAALAVVPASAGAAKRYDVTIARTELGVPHIKANDLASLGYGYAHALAEDNVCTVAEAYITANGERSRFFGPDATYSLRGNGTNPTNLNSDFVYQHIKDRRTVETLVAAPPPIGPKPEVRRLLHGYVAGWNGWLRDIGGPDAISDTRCRGAAWVRPITIMDVYRRMYALSLLASTGVALDGIATAKPVVGSVDAIANALELAPGELDRRLGGLGSNAYAIGRTASQDGHGLLYGNPHFPWQGSERFYQSHLTIPGKMDVTGGSLLGVPIVLIGTTHGVAWSHTVSTSRRFVPYQLSLVPGSPMSYVQDGQVKRMSADNVTVSVRGKDGAIAPRTRTLYSSEHGPIFTSLLGLPLFAWTPLYAYALHDGNGANLGRAMNHFYEMNLARSVDDVDAILRRYQGLPWVNTIAADTAGNTLYADIGSVPNIPQDKYDGCQTPLGLAVDELQRLPVLDGSRAECLPADDPGAAAPGILPARQQPSLRRDDTVSNMNDSHWLTNPAQPLEGFSRIVGDERTRRSLRTRLGLIQIEQRLAGSDGLPGTTFTLENLMQIGLGDRVLSGELWRDDLVRACTSDGCDVLRRWDLHANLDSKGYVLWQRFVERQAAANAASLLPGAPAPLTPFSGSFDARDAVHTPAGLNILNPTVQLAFARAVADLRAAGLPLDASPRQAQTVTRGGERIPIHGGIGGAGVFNVITPVWDARTGYTGVVHGSSFIQAVHLAPGCPRVRTMLTYGQSTNSTEATKRFSDKQWLTLPFCARELEADRSAVRVHTADVGGTTITVREARAAARPRITVVQRAHRPARVTIRVRRSGRVVRTIRRRAATTVAIAPRLPRGAYRVDVALGANTIRLAARQR
jgi:acyl-homoserine-lactone acylase